MRFEKFYEVVSDVTPGQTNYVAISEGVLFGITPKQITVLGPLEKAPLPSTAKELSVDAWKALGFPIGLMFNEEPKHEAPKRAERELTEDEQKLDDQYERDRRDWWSERMKQGADVLAAHREAPIFVTTTTTTESHAHSGPLLVDALAAFLRAGPSPVDPIGWRRRQPVGGGIAALLPSVMGAVTEIASGWTSSQAAKAAPEPPPKKSE